MSLLKIGDEYLLAWIAVIVTGWTSVSGEKAMYQSYSSCSPCSTRLGERRHSLRGHRPW
jgi:hypothetical protein